jgi:acetaldehyde dehydrogenase
VGGAASAKTIVVLNPAEPKIMMRNTIYLEVESALGADDETAVREAIARAMARVQEYVPGYRAAIRPECERNTVKIALEVTGRGDYLPPYAGNLDIMTAAAVAVAEGYSRSGQAVLAGGRGA